MEELVTVEQTGRALFLLALAMPVAGLLIGAGVGMARKQVVLCAVTGLSIGAAGPALLVLWTIFNTIMAIFGLDSVRGLLVSIALFAVIGLAVGAVVGRIRRRLRKGSESGASTGTE